MAAAAEVQEASNAVNFPKARNSWLTAVKKLFGTSKDATLGGNSSETEVVVGPVIGKVTCTSARILLEVKERATVRMILQAQAPIEDAEEEQAYQFRNKIQHEIKKFKSVGSELKAEKQMPAMRPTVFEFQGLKPGTRYSIELQGCKPFVISSSFITFPEVPYEKMNVGVTSCNKIFVAQQASSSDLWSHLAKSIDSGNIHLLLHLGDQVYGDGDKLIDKEAGLDHDKWSNRFRHCEAMLKDQTKEMWECRKDIVCEKYREVYRETWRHLPTAKCLANCPNLMIYDDHEIRDNWADAEEDWEPGTLHFFIAHCAWIVYLEYQRQLYEDIDLSNISLINKDHHLHVVGGVGIMFLDIRGCRSFHRVDGDDKPYLGSLQWQDIKDSLGTNGMFDEVRMLLVCSPAPLVFLEHMITDAAGKNVPRLIDFKGHWSASRHIKEQTQMIDTLLEWKLASNRREVLVLGGDVHCGGHSHILKNGEVIFNQLTTSAIANRPLPKSAYYFMRAAGRLGNLSQGYTFRHHHWTRSRNYGLVQIQNYRPQDTGGVDVASQLVIGKLVGGIKTGDRVSNRDISSTKCGCWEFVNPTRNQDLPKWRK